MKSSHANDIYGRMQLLPIYYMFSYLFKYFIIMTLKITSMTYIDIENIKTAWHLRTEHDPNVKLEVMGQ